MSQGQWCCLPRVLWEMPMEVWMGKKGRAQEWTVPFFKCHACKTICDSFLGQCASSNTGKGSQQSLVLHCHSCMMVSHFLVNKAVLIRFFSYSGKTIPNGTDKNQLGTPENEGKFQKCPLFTIKKSRYVFLLGCRSPPAGYFV